MTDKRKRGRPKKVKTIHETAADAAKTMGLQNTEMYLPGGLSTASFGNGDVREIKQIYKKNDGSVTITIGPSEKLIPPAGLSKTEILAWYTKQNAKK